MNHEKVDPAALARLDVNDPASALEFRRGVAMLAGWRVELFKTRTYTLPQPAQHQWFRIWDATGNPIVRETAYSAVNEWPDYELDEPLPPFETSLDAALTLPLERFCHWTFKSPGVGSVGTFWYVDVWSACDEDKPIAYGVGETAALAVCRAYLAYRAARRESEG